MLVLLVQLPPVQNFIARKVTAGLNKGMEANISADRMYISLLNKVKVRGLVVTDRYQDTVISASGINVGFKLFPLVKNEIRLGRIQLDDPQLQLVRHRQDSLLNIAAMFRRDQHEKEDRTPNPPPEISFSRLRINNLDFKFEDHHKQSSISVAVERLLLLPEAFDLEKQVALVSKLEIRGLFLDILNPPVDTTERDQGGSTPQAQPDLINVIPWTLGVEQLELRNNNVDIRQRLHGSRQNKQVLTVQQLDTEMEGISIDSVGYAAAINSLSGTINNNLDIGDLKLSAMVDNNRTVLRDGSIRFNDSRFQVNASLNYTSARRLITQPGSTRLQMDLRAEANTKDISELISTDLALRKYPKVQLFADISGTLDSIRIDSISGSAGDAVHLRISGALNKILEMEHLSGSLNLSELSVYRDPLFALVPDTLRPTGLELPEEITLVAKLEGNRQQVSSDLSVLTSLGAVYSELELTMDTIADKEKARLNIYTDAFDLGTLLKKQDTIGEVVFAGQVLANSTGFKSPVLEANMNIARATVFGYTYSGLTFNGDYDNELLHIQSVMEDPNSSFVITGEYHFNDSVPEVFLEADIRQLRLQALNFADTRSDLQMKISAGIHGLDPASMLGNVKFGGMGFQTETSNYSVDSLKLFFDGGTRYRMLLGNLHVNDTLYAHELELLSEKQAQMMELDYTGTFENIPGTREGLIRVTGDGSLLMDPDSLVLSSDLTISNNSFPDTSIYRIDFSRVLPGKDRSAYDLYLAGTSLQLNGSARLEQTGETQRVDGKAHVDSLQLALLQPFLADALKSLSGIVSGDITMGGTLADPELNGAVTFRNTQFYPSALNTSFTLENETVKLANQQISVDRLTLRDNQDNTAVLNGTVDLRKSSESNFDLSLVAREFHLVNKSAATGDLYYGNVFADLDGNVSGTFNQPVIQLNSAFRKESDFSFVIPSSKTPTGEGIVKFVDADLPESQRNDSLATVDSIRARATNLQLTASASFTDRFTLNIITNPLTGERLLIRGDGNLGFSLDRSGAMSLIGRYEISEGNYTLRLFDLIKREFYIESGSYLSWSGEIMDATADLAAIYQVNASLEELLQYQQGTTSDATYGSADFEVVMRLTGPLMTPEIKFDIRSAEQGAPIRSALSALRNNESELNKQVFSLLVFGRFMGASATTSDPRSYEFSNQSRQSLSNLLSKQLDRFADQYIKKVDLDIDIDSYETGMESDVSARTDVSMNLSTDVFNDRLTLEVGGSVAVEEPGTQGGNLQAGDLAGDFRVEYKLTRDGVYRVNVFNNTDYENEIDGEVTKTGVSFIFNKDFTRFRDLFGRKEEGGQDEE